MNEPSVPEVPSQIHRAGKGYRFEAHGWIYLHVEGEADERGFQHGQLMARELGEIVAMLRQVVLFDTGKPWSFFTEAAEKLFAHHLDAELSEEIHGIAEGARQAGAEVDWSDVLAWNGFEELLESWWPQAASGLGHTPGSPRSKGR
ncbi:MAG: hypothetical protein HC897_16565, partial [Thermoanaerobaculia bacterium]|nr:hypothetical protein [Thermoanaerobaculia bacterium]